jgi:hypothetical protein
MLNESFCLVFKNFFSPFFRFHLLFFRCPQLIWNERPSNPGKNRKNEKKMRKSLNEWMNNRFSNFSLTSGFWMESFEKRKQKNTKKFIETIREKRNKRIVSTTFSIQFNLFCRFVTHFDSTISFIAMFFFCVGLVQLCWLFLMDQFSVDWGSVVVD